MRRRWYYLKRTLWAIRPLFPVVLAVFLCVGACFQKRAALGAMAGAWYKSIGIPLAARMLKEWFPAEAGKDSLLTGIQPSLFPYLAGTRAETSAPKDPVYGRFLAAAGEKERLTENRKKEVFDASGETATGEAWEAADGENEKAPARENAEASARPVNPGIPSPIRRKLADYDYLMNTFYSVHPTTTASREMMKADAFLDMDLSIEKHGDGPQILIYHTHSQEEFSDWPENTEATIVGVGAYLAELLEARGYGVLHDKTVYDVREGTLDRSRAYTYALEGISGILQKHPDIQVVLDVHRDGVKEGTRLVTEINGKPTAKIMFFNGTSQTPDGPIEYLPNPNREANMAFSFQMQLRAAEQFPGFTRKIYLKGLRYNQHVRARSALIEVGAQTNTYEEARNAMEPLAELLEEVLGG